MKLWKDQGCNNSGRLVSLIHIYVLVFKQRELKLKLYLKLLFKVSVWCWYRQYQLWFYLVSERKSEVSHIPRKRYISSKIK